MRILNSVCKVLADNYPNTPVYIEQVPQDFVRPSFLVAFTTQGREIKNYRIYQKNPIIQIVYFWVRDEANQVEAEGLYAADDKLDELFLLPLALPIIPRVGVIEKQRYAKITAFTSEVRLDEGAIYARLTLSFTEDIPHVEPTDKMEYVELVTETTQGG